MATITGTLILVASANGASTASYTGGSSAWASIKDPVSNTDGDSTYIYDTIALTVLGSPSNSNYKMGIYSGSIPSGAKVTFTGATLSISARHTSSKSGDSATLDALVKVGDATSAVSSVSNSSKTLSSSYTTYTFPTTAFVTALASYTALPNIELDIGMDGIKGNKKNDSFEARVTSVTLAITYSYDDTQYTVSVSNPTGATITASKTGSVYSGTTITLSSTLDNGYTLAAYTVNGTTITGNTFTVSANSVVSANLNRTTPTVTLGTPTRTIISDENGYTQCVCTFTCDLNCAYWEARAVYNGGATTRGSGTLVESGTNLTANTSASIIVDYSELTNGDGTYKITIYAHATNGMWSDGVYVAIT